MRYSVSDTAEYGDYTRGPRIVTAETKKVMQQMLCEIKDGTYAKKWIAENEAGRPWFKAMRAKEQEHPIEKVGARLRDMMPFLDPVKVRPDMQG
jgi:ketol-acid reductoisomerase